MLVKVGGEKIDIKKLGEFGKVIGLMFSSREKAKALLFEFKKPTRTPIHSLFVFYPFVAIWINSEGKVVEKKIVKPWKLSIRPKENFVRLIEIPINRRYEEIVKSLDGRNIYKEK